MSKLFKKVHLVKFRGKGMDVQSFFLRLKATLIMLLQDIKYCIVHTWWHNQT